MCVWTSCPITNTRWSVELMEASVVTCALTVVIQLLQDDIARHKEKVQSLCDTADQFTQQKHFMADELHDRTKRISERYLVLTLWQVADQDSCYHTALNSMRSSHDKAVRPSACPSNACIVTKRKHLVKKVQLWLIGSRQQAFQWA